MQQNIAAGPNTLGAVQAIVITLTVGEAELRQALDSVSEQSVRPRHLVVVDGLQHLSAVNDCIRASDGESRVDLLTLPRSTGGTGLFGHRAIAAAAFTVHEGVIFLLGADNVFKPDHIETCLAALEASGSDWCYALREIMGQNGETMLEDDGDSLGFWPRAMYYNAQRGFYSPLERRFALSYPFLVDTSCFCVKRPTFIRFAGIWDNGHGTDSVFATALIHQANGVGTGYATVRYRLHGTKAELKRQFFENSNQLMRRLYAGQPPWRRRVRSYVARPMSLPEKLPPDFEQDAAAAN